MPRATTSEGALAVLDQCKLITPCGTICFYILPEISDSKSANYASENIPGRSTPLMTYAWSDPRMISTVFHFMTTKSTDIPKNFIALRTIQSLVYPGGANGVAPFVPPPAVRLKCGQLLQNDNPLDDSGICVILKNYNISYPTNVAWDSLTYLPYQFAISCSWEVVYACKNLPTNQCIVNNIFAPFIDFSQNNPAYQKGLP